MGELDTEAQSERDFTWVKTCPAIADALRGRNSKDPVLLALFNEANNVELNEIDPFSLFASFNRGLKWETRTEIIRSVLQAMSIQGKAPEHFEGIPVADSRNYLYHSSGMDTDCENCWALFNLALSYADDRNSVKLAEFAEAFDKVMQIRNVSHGKLTMALYWIRPTIYMPLDNNSKAFLAKHLNIKVPHTGLTGAEYLSILDMIRSSSDAPMYELSADAYDEMRAENGWKPSLADYNPGFSTQDWVQMLNDKELFTDNSLALLKRLLDFGGEASCAQLSEAYGETPNFYNVNASTAAKRIYDKTGCLLNTTAESEDAQYWPILFFSKAASKGMSGNYIWKLRPELEEALKAVDLSQIPLHASQQTRHYWWLNAKPGYWTFDRLGVGDTEEYTAYNDEGNKRQKYKYFETAQPGDLVVGYHTFPQMEAVCICQIEKAMDSNATDVHDRFITIKKIADASKFVSHDDLKTDSVLSQMEYVKGNPTGSLFSLTPNEFSRMTELMGLPEYSSMEEDPMSKTNTIDLNTILYGPPGTGKTFRTMAYAVGICDGEGPNAVFEKMKTVGYEEVAARYRQLEDEGRVAFTTFHQSYGYEEFIEGIRPVLKSDDDNDESGQIHYDLFDGVFKEFCKRADDTAEILASAGDIPFFGNNTKPTVWKIGLKIDSVPDLYMKCHEDGVIRLGWDQVPFGGYETDETITRSNRACIQAFEEEMQLGDFFVVPASDSKLVSIGIITGDCEWVDNYSSAKRTRKVQWLGDFSKIEFKRLNGGKQLTLQTIYKLNRVNFVDLLAAMGKVSQYKGIASPKVKEQAESEAEDVWNWAAKIGTFTFKDKGVEHEWEYGFSSEFNQNCFIRTTEGYSLRKEDFFKDYPDFKRNDLWFKFAKHIVKEYKKDVPATKAESKPFVFIIDEINRGEISKIFGELITLLEDSKRVGAREEKRVRLPYSGDNFGVPSNVYVVGTMNSADRSTALIDTALRRRFNFVEMMPDPDTLAGIEIQGINLKEMLDVMNERIEFLFDREHTIGHAYLTPLKSESSIELLSELFDTRVIPLLQEYFFDDYSKIRAVLGNAADRFIECVPLDESHFVNVDTVRPASVIYRVLPAPEKAEAYREIYASDTKE